MTQAAATPTSQEALVRELAALSACRWERQRFTPGPHLAWALASVAPLWLCGETWRYVALLANIALLALAWLESRSLRARLPELTRSVPARLALSERDQNTISLALRNVSASRVRGRIRDAAPEGFSCTPSELSFELGPLEQRTLSYSVQVRRRGHYSFGPLHLRLEGSLGLGAVIALQLHAANTRVYPSPRGPQRYELALRRGVLSGVGIRRARRPGGAGELDQLRQYVPGDALRDLAWKASAKRLLPISRVHGQEQSQSVLIALDAGRLMAAPLGELSKLDHAIHAALLLAWVALRAGDRVGLVVFERAVLQFVPPARGQAQYRRMLESVFALEASDAYVDFRALVSFVRRQVSRRSLLVVFSDLVDESQALPLAAELPKLQPKHLPLCVTLSDSATERLARGAVETEEEVYRRAAALDLLAERALVKRRIARGGVRVIEAGVGEVGAATVNGYLEIRGRGLL